MVLGLGGVGSFALRAAARGRKGKEGGGGADAGERGGANGGGGVLGIERFHVGHDRGSSHGRSRVYRRAYFEHSSYSPWVSFSVDEFKALEASSRGGVSVPIVEECGVLVVVPAKDRAWLDAALASAADHNVPTETLDVKALRERFPQYRYAQEDMVGLYEPGGGMVRPERATNAALAEAEDLYGATIWENAAVRSLQEVKSDDDDGGDPVVQLVVEKQGEMVTIQARTVLVAAGAWTTEILPSWTAPYLKPIRQLQTWLDTSQTDNPQLYDLTRMPCIVMVNPDLPIPVYCLPGDSNCDRDKDGGDKYRHCVKLGIHGKDVPIDPNVNYLQDVTPQEEEEMRQAIAATFCEQISAQPLIETKQCMYTMTPDEHFIIGVPKGYTRVCAVAGLSGHGFKMTPALGQMLADFACDGKKGLEKWKADFCEPSRFGL